MAGPRQEDGWIACTVLPQLISMPPSPSPSDFSARAHARYSEHLNPASWLLFSIFISSKLVAAKPSGCLFWYACSNLTCIFTSLNIKFSYLSTTIYEKEKFQLNQISWNWAELPDVAENVSPAKSIQKFCALVNHVMYVTTSCYILLILYLLKWKT